MIPEHELERRIDAATSLAELANVQKIIERQAAVYERAIRIADASDDPNTVLFIAGLLA